MSPTPVPAEPTEPVVGVDEAGYLALFLEQPDLPAMERVQDSRLQGPDAGDDAFSHHGGISAGFQAWMAQSDAVVWRLVDVRWVFPSAADAAAYHRETLRPNAEGHPAVPGAPLVGVDCVVHGGTDATPIDPTITMTAFYYLFRVRNVVVKLFVAQGPALPADALTPAAVAPLADRIRRRLDG
jgi:hypothetical protein